MARLIESWSDYRIIEVADETWDLDNLKGDCYSPVHNPDIPPVELRIQEREFEREINEEGVWGYELQKWNPSLGIGWETIDSCYGFVGMHSDDPKDRYNHYIVAEMKGKVC